MSGINRGTRECCDCSCWNKAKAEGQSDASAAVNLCIYCPTTGDGKLLTPEHICIMLSGIGQCSAPWDWYGDGSVYAKFDDGTVLSLLGRHMASHFHQWGIYTPCSASSVYLIPGTTRTCTWAGCPGEATIRAYSDAACTTPTGDYETFTMTLLLMRRAVWGGVKLVPTKWNLYLISSGVFLSHLLQVVMFMGESTVDAAEDCVTIPPMTNMTAPLPVVWGLQDGVSIPFYTSGRSWCDYHVTSLGGGATSRIVLASSGGGGASFTGCNVRPDDSPQP